MRQYNQNVFDIRLNDLDKTSQRQAAMNVKERLLTAKAIARSVLDSDDANVIANIASQLADAEYRWDQPESK